MITAARRRHARRRTESATGLPADLLELLAPRTLPPFAEGRAQGTKRVTRVTFLPPVVLYPMNRKAGRLRIDPK